VLYNRKVLDRWPVNHQLNARIKQAIKPKPLPPAFDSPTPAFDYVVIGAGAAGCALVATLLAGDTTATVLLLEAGDTNEVAEIQDFTQAMSLRGTIYDWGYQSQSQTCMNKQTMPYDAGKVNGGSSSINGMVWVRGNSADYDSWGALNPGWDYQSVLPVFMRQETFAGGASPYRGGTGPINVSASVTSNPISDDFNAACIKMGYTANADYNAATQYGVAYSQLNVKSAPAPVYGIRQDSYNAFVNPYTGKQLTQVTNAFVMGLEFDSQNTISQVAFLWSNRIFIVNCLRETILCAGALRSPQLLMVSGIGDATALKQLNIPVVADVPGVGQNLQDQLVSFVVRPLAKIDTGHFSPMCNNIFANGLPSTAGDATAPEYEVQTFYMANNPGFPPNQYAVGSIALHPLSRGSVTLASDTMGDAPIIQPSLLCDPADVTTSLTGLKMVREIASYFAANSTWLGAESMPGSNVITDAQLITYMKESSVPDFHYVGTCKMGPASDPQAVVDSLLRVRGVTGLRVADASIMPTVISGNTNACSNMIGGRCGDFITQA